MRLFFALSAILLSSQGFSNEKEVPVRQIALIITEDGYYPKTITAMRGEKVHFLITALTGEDSCFSMEQKKLFVSVKRGSITEVQKSFKEAGNYEFNCPTGNIKGQLMVLDPGGRKRGIASMAEVEVEDEEEEMEEEEERRETIKIWHPRDE